ncbi:MAG: hypothetical protein WBV37_07890 [Nocardioidaceae bacterium]
MSQDQSARAPDRKRVFFHIGAPKTGTTYLQHVLLQNQEALAAASVLYPYDDHGQSFRSMQDFRGAGWGSQRATAFKGEWKTVADRAAQWSGSTVIVSNELLGGASPDRIAAGVASVGPAEVHVIFSARDFARQLVSDWQEHIKHKHQVTLETFVDDLINLGFDAPAPFGEMFWGMHDAAYVLERWSAVVPAQRIHVVTLPPPGAPKDTLWRRFCQVTGLEADAYDAVTSSSNPSMGVAETELVRRMNADVQGMPPENYDPLVRVLLAEQVLGGQSPKLLLPPGRFDWVMERSRRLVSELEAAGYPVVGDLQELLPRAADHEGYVSPTELTDADLATAAIRAATGLLQHAGRQRRTIVELESAANGIAPHAPAPRERVVELYWRARGRVGKILRRLGLLHR